MRIGVLIPTRGDRTEFLRNAARMIEGQTLQPVALEIVNDAPRNEAIDLCWRYKRGYETLSKLNLDLIAFWEDDDWYHPEYLETMARTWEEKGRPLLLGCDYTIYYHLKLKKYFTFHHTTRSSMMNTVIRPNIPNIDWGPEHDPYTDLHLWTKLGSKMGDRVIFHPEKHICLGIKHAIGKTGGFYHSNELTRYEHDDNGFLENTVAPVDQKAFDFYLEMNKKLVTS